MSFERELERSLGLKPLLLATANGEKENPEDEKAYEKPSVLTQYFKAGNGFVATSDTVVALPPDCYKIDLNNDGVPVFIKQNIITDDLLRLPDSKSEEVIAEIEKFWSLKSKFKEYGFSHKRGFLLHGPAGSGKTSTISIVMKDMVKAGGTVFIATHPRILAMALTNFRLVEPNRPLVVIWEDLDAVIQMYGESEMLSVLDGESQVENVVFVATTNYPEDLQERVINRPSRFDKVVEIGFPNAEARKMYILAKVKEVVKDGVDLVEATKNFSIAHIKELIVSVYCQGNPVTETIERLKQMKHVPNSARSGSRPTFGLGGR